MSRRKSDKYRLIEKRGIGRNKRYKPWLRVHEVPSRGLSSEILGWKDNKVHEFLSNLERDYFFNLQWEDCVVEIREQYPLLPLEDTIFIAKEYGIKHPSLNNSGDTNIVMSTDFLITIDDGNVVKDIARTVKPSSNIDRRVKEKFKIEEIFWKRRNVDWGVVTEKEIDTVKARNIRFIYQYYFWNKSEFSDKNLTMKLFLEFWSLFLNNKYNLKKL